MNKYVDDEFINIAVTRHIIITGSTCSIIKDDSERENLKTNNPVWYDSIKSQAKRS